MFERPVLFAVAFVGFFIITVAFLAAVDALPEPISGSPEETQDISVTPTQPEAPVRVVAKSIGLDEDVRNPNTTDIEALDNELLYGAVRYPTSGLLNTDGTMLLFGHSSYLPIVRNQAYKAFNGIQKLKEGEVVSVYSDTTEYRYRVRGVRLADASEDVIPLPSDGKYLTLLTCESFGKKTDRFVVTADFEGAYALN